MTTQEERQLLFRTIYPQYLHSGYSRDNSLDGWYRPIKVEEAKHLVQNSQVCFKDVHGKVRQAKITSIKTWKTKPGCVVNLRYGLREFFSRGYADQELDKCLGTHRDILIPIEGPFDSTTPPEVVQDWLDETGVTYYPYVV